jgi:hypothetical protein
MKMTRRRSPAAAACQFCASLVAAGWVLTCATAAAQGLTGALIGTVRDAQGGTLPGAVVRVNSPALIGGSVSVTATDKGQWRFLVLPPGRYALEVEMPGFATLLEDGIRIGAGATLERNVVLQVAGVAESIVVEGAGSRIEARDPGFGTRFGLEDLDAMPTRRSSMFDMIRAAPGISPTSPSSGKETTVSAFGSGTNENQFLFDGTNFTCPCSGLARAEPGVDFIQEVQVQSVGASAEYGNSQGAVINVVMKQGGERFLSDSSYYGQPAAFTSQPVTLPYLGSRGQTSGYERAMYRDFTTSLGGPAIRDRLWFFGGYQYLRDHDSQPGTNPARPRILEQDKIFAKLTWRLTPGLQLLQSVHHENGINNDRPTTVTPAEAIPHTSISVPAVTFGHLTHTLSANTVWDARVGRFDYRQSDEPTPGSDPAAQSRFDRITGVTSIAPPRFGGVRISRTTVKATINHYRPALLGADHQWRLGGQFERGWHEGSSRIPTGVRFVDSNGQKFQSVSFDPQQVGGQSDSASAFVSDAITAGDRLTINAGVRFDHVRAISQDLPALDLNGQETGATVKGLGTLYTRNIVSPRLGVTVKLTADGRTVLRGSYGRFSQGVLTGELEFFHPGATATTTRDYVPADGDYTRVRSVVDPDVNLQLDRGVRTPHTDEYSIGVDRELGRRLAVALAYVRKDGANFIGWTDVGGQYVEASQPLSDGRTLPVFRLVNTPADRRFLETNPDGYLLTYNGLVAAAEKRRADGWHVFGSYTWSKTYGLQAASGTTAAGAQVSTVGPPRPSIFGRDPNDLTNALGRLPNDRPHMFRVMGSVDVPGTGLIVAANFQHFSGKPWAHSAQLTLPQGPVRVLLEPRGTRRLPSQSLLDVRVSRAFSISGLGRIDLLLDILNALDDAAPEGIATDTFDSPTLGQPVVFMDPRRAMIGVRLNLGR